MLVLEIEIQKRCLTPLIFLFCDVYAHSFWRQTPWQFRGLIKIWGRVAAFVFIGPLTHVRGLVGMICGCTGLRYNTPRINREANYTHRYWGASNERIHMVAWGLRLPRRCAPRNDKGRRYIVTILCQPLHGWHIGWYMGVQGCNKKPSSKIRGLEVILSCGWLFLS